MVLKGTGGGTGGHFSQLLAYWARILMLIPKNMVQIYGFDVVNELCHLQLTAFVHKL